MKRITKLSFVVAALLGLSSAAFAQQPQVAAADPAATVAAVTPPSNLTVQPAAAQLPKLASKYEGRWTFVFNGREIGNTLSLLVNKQNADGSIEGRYTFWPAQWASTRCVLKDAPTSGTWDGRQLSLKITTPEEGCPPIETVLLAGEKGQLTRSQTGLPVIILSPISN